MNTFGEKPFLVLENGDRLTRDEFERRYGQCSHIKKAELINGVVFVASPVRVQHAQPHGQIMTWLGNYAVACTFVMLCDNVTVRLDGQNEVQPDALLRLDQSVGGRSQITPDNYIEGPPELIVEIASSSASYDLHDKKEVYCRCGVKEYLVWVVGENSFYWYQLVNQTYVQQLPCEEGILRSREFAGLWLNLPALLKGVMQPVMFTLQTRLGSPEYQKFIDALTSRK
ncbi:MAG: Uma2 family endonuclease [Pseudanabaenaceae cyanobacterium]